VIDLRKPNTGFVVVDVAAAGCTAGVVADVDVAGCDVVEGTALANLFKWICNLERNSESSVAFMMSE
jgi:hypothetical protein